MFTFEVRPDGAEPFTVVATSRDVVMWEKTTPGRCFSHLREAAMADFYGVAYVAAKRLGRFDGTRQDFDTGVDIDIVQDEEPDPTQTGP